MTLHFFVKGLAVWARRGLRQEHVPDEQTVRDARRNPRAAVEAQRVLLSNTQLALCLALAESPAKFKSLDPETELQARLAQAKALTTV